MERQHLAIGVGLAAVAALAFLLGHSCPREFQPPSPVSGGPPGTRRPTRKAGVATTAAPSGQPTSRVAAAPSLTSKMPEVTPGPAASLVSAGRYENRALGLAVRKPEGQQWEMTDNRLNFRDPVRHPAKVLEIRRNPKDPEDKRFAIIELYVLEDTSPGRERKEVEKLERLGQRAQLGKFKLLKEDTIGIGGKDFGRRVVLWEAKKARAQFLSLWRASGGRLYVLLAMTEPRWFEQLLPEFNEAIESLRVP